MKRIGFAFALVVALIAIAIAAPASAATVERLYVLDCGHARAPDQSRWSPGVNVGVPIDISDNCYLIRHGHQWLLWDTGIPDAVADMPNGIVGGPTPWQRPVKLFTQLKALGVSPASIRYVAVSHSHGDHIGNVDMFPKSTLLIQRAEWDFAFAPGKPPPFNPKRPVKKLSGDYDIFADGSARLISTPGHTPGHQSLLIHLPKTGWVILSGDVAHSRSNWDNRRVPSMNTDRDQTLASMQRIADLMKQYHAQLWINHDAAQTASMLHPPHYYD
jgi:glyoxylase-like metal-dependent hydrolase (beta-lactamase superfamily II)